MTNLTRRQLLAALVLTLQSAPEAAPVSERAASVVAMLVAREAILQELAEPGATTTVPELRATTGFSEHTLRAALESLYADALVDVEAVYWRPDRTRWRS